MSGKALADELHISLRTLYRDVATLQAQGAAIEGEPGLGYVLKPGFMLPPLMFSEDEIEAIVLGSRWVSHRADDALAGAARNAVAKIAAVLPSELREHVYAATLLVGPAQSLAKLTIDLAVVRGAIRSERKMVIRYRRVETTEPEGERTIWPFALGFFENVRVLVAWCEFRQAFRHFRADRIASVSVSKERYGRSRRSLLNDWRDAERIPEPDRDI